MKFSKINLLTLVCTGIFALQAQADLVMFACPYTVVVDNPDFPDLARRFDLNPSPGLFYTEAFNNSYGYNSWNGREAGNTGPTSSAWTLARVQGNIDSLQPALQGADSICNYTKAIAAVTFQMRKSTAPYCACTAGVFDILGGEYHFACQTTGCTSGGGSNVVSFSNGGMRTAASTLKSLQVPINKTPAGTTSSQLVGVDISAKNVKSASTVFIDAAKKSGIKIISVQEFKAQ